MNRSKIKRCIIAGIFMTAIAGCSSVSAQRIGMAGLHFQIGFPQGEFHDNIDNNSYGLNGEFFYSPGRTPLAVGLVFGYEVYGSQSRKEPFSTTIPDVTVKVTTTNNIFLGHFALRAIAKRGDIRPYAEGLVGFNYLFTDTKISDASDGSEVASSTNFDDFVFSWGAGGGVMVRVLTTGGENKIHWMLDLGGRYMLGNEAEYLKEGSIRRTGSDVEYDVIKSKTNLLTARIGVSAFF